MEIINDQLIEAQKNSTEAWATFDSLMPVNFQWMQPDKVDFSNVFAPYTHPLAIQTYHSLTEQHKTQN